MGKLIFLFSLLYDIKYQEADEPLKEGRMMRRTAAIFFLLLVGVWTLQAVEVPLPVVAPGRPPAVDAGYRFQVQGIGVASSLPCKVTFAVKYYISPTFPKACYIAAFIPDKKALDSGRYFGTVPAGRPGLGVPKGQHVVTDRITFSMDYVGLNPNTYSTIEVAIYDADGTILGSEVFTYRKNWTRFEVQAIQVVEERPDFVKFRVQYFIDSTYSPNCSIVTGFPTPLSGDMYWWIQNATGTGSEGVPKGQVGFWADVWLFIRYERGPTVTSTTVPLTILYNPRALAGCCTRNLPLIHTWVAPGH